MMPVTVDIARSGGIPGTNRIRISGQFRYLPDIRCIKPYIITIFHFPMATDKR